ncbi:MAG: T9SS type A sorting domain-containing protein [Candidatus Marinimicrobia bacterium]|nr:T9SS type A sorting domain-containing protein [Candidatus Neomarinimicrobiota bacterium]
MSKITSIFILSLLGAVLFAQNKPQNWSVDPHNYEYFATITTEVKIDNRAITDEGTLAAFQEDESCCGVSDPMNINGRKIYFLMVYSNETGIEIGFKFYNSVKDSVYELENKITFASGESYGNVDDPGDFSTAPENFKLYQNYPNPFNPSTTITFSIPESDKVEVLIYDVAGKLIKKLYEGTLSAGYHDFLWNAENDIEEKVSSGIYLYSVNYQGHTISRKMNCVK